MGLTRKRDLRYGNAVWTAYRHLRVPCRRLRSDQRVEVAVVGAGISGALVSQALTEKGYRPLILDRRHGARLGSTAASTALLQFELDTPLIELTRSIGKAAAQQVWVSSRDAVKELQTRAERLGIRAHLQPRPSLYLAGNRLDARGLRREATARGQLGLASEWLSGPVLRHHFGLHRSAAILSHGNLEADPVSLAAGFLQCAIDAGAALYAPHEVTDLQRARGGGAVISTADGREITARHVVLCTGYEVPKIVPLGDNRIQSTWAIATRRQPQKLWPQRALIWEASEPYLYLRSTFDGRVICGGEDEEYSEATRRNANTDAKRTRLEVKLKRLMPEVDARAQFAWTGAFGSSPNGVPTIGQVPGCPRVYSVLGYGGNGITFSMLAAMLIAAQISGRRDPKAKLFEFR
jgi:glycine/D-amino acid oxidase-like deaminating enzyme